MGATTPIHLGGEENFFLSRSLNCKHILSHSHTVPNTHTTLPLTYIYTDTHISTYTHTHTLQGRIQGCVRGVCTPHLPPTPHFAQFLKFETNLKLGWSFLLTFRDHTPHF